jgi:cation transporter-like permease
MGIVARLANEFSIGQWAIAKIQFLGSVAILLKLFDSSWYWYLISLPLLMFITWLIGIIIHRTGLWDNFIRENLKKGINK